MVASHTAVPLGTAKWLVWDYPPNILACLYGRRHVLRMSLTYSKVLCVWVSPSPAISPYITARLYGWLPLSNASGISFPCNTTQDWTPTAFLPLQHDTRLNTYGISFPCNTTQNQTPKGIFIHKEQNTFCRISESCIKKLIICTTHDGITNLRRI